MADTTAKLSANGHGLRRRPVVLRGELLGYEQLLEPEEFCLLADSSLPTPAAAPGGRAAGIVIVASALLTIFAVAHHPTLRAKTPETLIAGMVALAPLDMFVHGSLIAIIIALVAGFAVFTARLGLNEQSAIAAFVVYSLGAFAVVGAALIDGFLTPAIAFQYEHAHAAEVPQGMGLLVFASLAIQVLTKFGFIAMSVGVLFWSIGLLRRARIIMGIGVLGILSALGVVAVLAFGGAFLTPPVLGVIVLVQAFWYVAIGVALVQKRL